MAQKNLRIEDELLPFIKQKCIEQNISETRFINDAIKFYRDYDLLENSAPFINDQILTLTKSMFNNLERNINYKTNKYLSEVAIQLTIANMVIAGNLELDTSKLSSFRRAAVSQLENSKAILSLERLIGDD